jgi:carbon storage regulator CsrA
MLVLSRKQGEQLQIGNNVTVTVLEVRGHTLKLGIQAPNSVRILRAELPDWNGRTKSIAKRRPAKAMVGA